MSDKVEALVDALERAVIDAKAARVRQTERVRSEERASVVGRLQAMHREIPYVQPKEPTVAANMITCTVHLHEAEAEAFHRELTSFFDVTNKPVAESVLRAIDLQVAHELEERAPIAEKSRVVYAGTKRAGVVRSILEADGYSQIYAVVEWDEWTKTPFTAVPLENLRKEPKEGEADAGDTASAPTAEPGQLG